MIRWTIGKVLGIVEAREGFQQSLVQTDDEKTAMAIYYPQTNEQLQIGDEVLLNTTAVELGLGSGGVHFVHAVLNRPVSQPAELQPGHIMKLRYTSLQRATWSVEEPSSPYRSIFEEKADLSGTPVIIGELHSMLPALVTYLHQAFHRIYHERKLRLAYIMTDGGALPLALSKHVDELKRLGWIEGTVTIGNAFGGDLEAVNAYTGLLAAKKVWNADILLMMMGPGIVGTGTDYGFTGVEAGEHVNRVNVLNGIPIAAPRISFADQRVRHYGVSHHSLISFGKIATSRALIPVPALTGEQAVLIDKQIEEAGWKDIHEMIYTPSDSIANYSLEAYPLPITTMGRGVKQDPVFFQTLAAVAQVSLRQLNDEG